MLCWCACDFSVNITEAVREKPWTRKPKNKETKKKQLLPILNCGLADKAMEIFRQKRGSMTNSGKREGHLKLTKTMHQMPAIRE